MFALTYVEIDLPSFNVTSPVEIVTYRWALPTDYLPPEIDCIPSISAVSFTPMLVSLGKDLGQRAKISVTFTDHRHIFNGEPYTQGTFWGKWRGRYGTSMRGAPMRIIRGQVGQAIADMDIRHYLVDASAGPDPNNGTFVIEAKDILKFADDDRAQAPVLSSGSLAGSINVSTTSATLSPSGIGNAEYPASGHLSLGGKEIVSFTRAADVLTMVRGQLGSVASAHDAGDRAQIVLRYTGNDAADIIYDLLTGYAGIDPSYINLTEWQTETAANLGVIYARTIAEPTSVNELVAEMIEQGALALWWDDRALKIGLAVLREIATDTAAFTEENIIAGSMRVQEQPGTRISQIWTYYGTRDPTNLGAEEDNFRAALADVDLEKEDEYGSAEIYKINGSWIETEAGAQRLNAIQLSRFRDPPRNFRFSLVAGELISLVKGYTLEWWANQNALGVAIPAKIQITQIAIYSDRIEVEAEEMLASGDLPALVNIVFLTSGTTFTVPATWNDADNSIHAIGGGGGGGNASPSFVQGGGGGGGGAYSAIVNANLTPAAVLTVHIGAGGAATVAGGDTWFNGASLAASSVGAKGGTAGAVITSGNGGAAGSGIGTTKNSGGDGGDGGSTGSRAGGGGGGGAGGPNDDGAEGSRGTNGGGGEGGGGGGADGGFDGGGDTTQPGGNNRFDFGGGNSTTPSGDEGGGGFGGSNGEEGGPGGAGEQIWTQTIAPITSAGPGGGAGGGGGSSNGGAGGLYGGGGGGGGRGSGQGLGGPGAQGIIVVIWRNL